MVKVMATGVFDIMHIGHLHFLEAARALGDELVVVVASDATVRRRKHVPINDANTRAMMVAGLKPVTRAVVGGEGDPLDIVEAEKPDIIVIGYDQDFDEKELEKKLAERGLKTNIRRTGHFDSDLDGTRKIIRSIGIRLAQGEMYNGEDSKEDEN